jgi:hypothetical protein
MNRSAAGCDTSLVDVGKEPCHGRNTEALGSSVQQWHRSQGGPGDDGPEETVGFVYGKLGSVDAAGDYADETPNEAGANDSIWIDIGAPPADTEYGNPSSFQIISAGKDEAGSRLFVGNLTMHSDGSNEPGDEVLVFSEEDAVSVPAVQRGAWIADVTYDEPSSAPPLGQTITFTATVATSGLYSPMESDYSGSLALYQDMIIV